MVVPNEEADPDCAVDCPSPLGGGYFVLPSREQLGKDFFDVIARGSEDIEDSDTDKSKEEEQDESDDDKEEEVVSDDDDKKEKKGSDEGETSDDNKSESGESRKEDSSDELSYYKCKRVDYLERYISNLELE